MRMWHEQLIPIICNKHKVGMHGEIHKFRHNFVKQHSIKGRISPIVQIEPEAMKERHDQLAKLLKNHNSPYEQPDLSYLPDDQRHAIPDLQQDIQDLIKRCPECRKNIEAMQI